jgi:hypothetical protein
MVESDSWRNTSAGVELSAASSGKSPKSRRKKKAVAGVDEAASAEESKIVGIEILDEEEGDSRKQSTDLLAPPGAEAASGSTAPAPVEEVAGGADDVATCEDCLKQRVVSTRTFDNKPYQLCGNCNRKREREARRAEAGETGAAAGATARPGADKAEHSDFTDYMGTLRHKRGAQIASFHPNKCAWWFAGVLTRFPYLVMALSMFIPLVFSLVVGANEFVLDTGEEGFRVVGEPVANRYDAVKLGRSETVYRELSPEQQAIVDASVLERSQVKFSLQVIFEADSEEEVDMGFEDVTGVIELPEEKRSKKRRKNKKKPGNRGKGGNSTSRGSNNSQAQNKSSQDKGSNSSGKKGDDKGSQDNKKGDGKSRSRNRRRKGGRGRGNNNNNGNKGDGDKS